MIPENSKPTPDPNSKVRMADTPHTVKRTNSVSPEEWRKVPRAIHLSYLLILVQDPHRELNEFQLRWIAYFSGKLSETQLFRAYAFYHRLNSDETLLRRNLPMINEAHRRIPLDGPPLPERRRIGIGYRDKGALRPLHQKREMGEMAFWDQDIISLLPLDYKVEGKWITASEVRCLSGDNILELLRPSVFWNSRHLSEEALNRDQSE